MAVSKIAKQIMLKSYEGTATTDGDGDFRVGQGVLTKSNSVIVSVQGIRDSQGYAGWHGYIQGTDSTGFHSFKVIADNGNRLTNTAVHYIAWYIPI